MSEDFYEVLGVSRDASEEDIEKAYRQMARKYHPDVSDQPDAEETFKKAKKAKEVLTDEEKRQMYDQLGHDRFEQAEKHGGVGGGAGGAGGMGGDPFGGGGGGGPFGNMQDIFDQFFGGGGRRSQGPQQGQDLKTSMAIDLGEAYEGVDKQLTVRRPEACEECEGTGHPPGSDSRTCPQCNGQGQETEVQQTPMGRVQQTRTCRRCEGEGTLYDETCSACRGDGTVHNEATLTVEVPAGIRDGQTLRMDGEGAPGDAGARPGDLLIDVSIRDHPDFERDGDDLKHQQAISFPQAVFGDTIDVPTLDGTVEFEVPAGTQSGKVFRLAGKGMPHLRRRGQGDLYVQVQVVTPESLNDEQKEALEAFAEAGGEEVSVDEGFFERLKNSL